MALRWCAAGMGEAAKQFRRVNGHLHLAALRAALDAHTGVTTTEYNKEEAAERHRAATQVPRNWDILEWITAGLVGRGGQSHPRDFEMAVDTLATGPSRVTRGVYLSFTVLITERSRAPPLVRPPGDGLK